MILEETLEKIKKPSQEAMERCRQHWDSIAKPLHSLGKLEDALVRIAGMTGNERIHLDKKALVVMCADNGVVEEGVTQSGQEVTAIVSENMLSGKATSSIMCRSTGADIFPVDIGIARDTSLRNEKVAYGTKNMAKGPAMTRQEAVQAIETGIRIVRELKEKGYQIKCLNLKEMEKSNQYDPFHYIRKEEDIIKLVTNIQANTTPPDAMKGILSGMTAWHCI